MSTETNKAIVRRWVEEGWNKGNLALVDELYAPNVVQHDPSSPAPVTNSEALKMYVTGYRTAFPDLLFTIDDLIAEGDKVVWRFTSRGTQKGPLMNIPPSGKTGTVTGIAIFRIADAKIAEVWVNVDTLGLLQQIGVIPAPGQAG
jgi:steroid delta-isomerase-like uncharacterized protein